MILGLDRHPQAACFLEVDAAVSAMTDRVVCFNAHTFEAPPGAVVFNLENVPRQVDPSRWAGHEVWDFSERNAAQYKATHVPIGYHPSMERFERAPTKDIDVVFSGCLNERRMAVLQGLADRGLDVAVLPPGVYGKKRDDVLARARLALNMLYYEDGVFPALRVAHLVANRVPVLSEACPEGWSFVPTCAYGEMVDAAVRLLREGQQAAEVPYEEFRKMPMVLP